MSEQRKQDVAKEYIEKNIDYIGKELNDFKEDINSSLIDVKSILGSEKVGEEDDELEGLDMLGINGVMNVLFRKDGKQRTQAGYEFFKFFFIKEESKKKLDILFEALDKSKTEEELRNNLKDELDRLKNDIQNNVDNGNNTYSGNNVDIQSGLSDLTSEENREMMNLVEKSHNINNIKYLENPTYKKYLNIIERDLNLPKYTLECVCYQESKGLLYKNGHIIGSHAGAQGLFQFMPGTADQYMKHNKLNEKYGKTFSSRDDFLKDPLASAWAAGIMYSEFMNKYHYNLQTSLACYNWGIGNYQNRIGKRNLMQGDMDNLPEETRKYVNNITKDIMKHNSLSSDDIFADLGGYKRNSSNINTGGINIESRNIELLAKNRDQLGGIGSSIMNGIMNDYNNPDNSFINMNGINSATTRNHKWFVKNGNELKYKGKNGEEDMELGQYCNKHGIKSFMFYFGGNEAAISQSAVDTAFEDIKEWANYLQNKGIQPVLCTCAYEKIIKHSIGHRGEKFPLADGPNGEPGFNTKIRNLGKERGWPVIDFAKKEKDIPISPNDQLHPTSDGYLAMRNIIGIKPKNEIA